MNAMALACRQQHAFDLGCEVLQSTVGSAARSAAYCALSLIDLSASMGCFARALVRPEAIS